MFFQQNTRLPAPRFYDCDRITTIAPDNVLIMLLCIRGLNIKAYGDIFLLHGNTIGECIPHFLTSIGYGLQYTGNVIDELGPLSLTDLGLTIFN